MVKMVFDLDAETDKEFRATVASVKGLHRGVIKEALKEAVQLWIEENKSKNVLPLKERKEIS